MKTGVIKRTSLPTSARFDASYHLSEGETVKRTINNSPYKLISVGDAAERIWHAGRWKRAYVSKSEFGIPLIGSSDMLKSDLTDIKLISKKYTPDIEDKKLQKGWILISCSGTIGNTIFTTKQYAERLASQDIIRLLPNNILKPGYLYAYLSSKYGYSLLTQGTFGAVIQHIEPNNVAGIPIPVFPDDFQAKVDDLIQESSRLREEAADLLEKAKNMVEEFISEKFVKHYYKCQTTSFNNVLNSLRHRLDPPALINDGVSSMDNVISKHNTRKISEIDCKVYRPGIFKRCYVQNGIPYIKGSEIFMTNPFLRCDYLSKTKTPFVDEMKLKEGQILITCAGSVGETKYITKEYEKKKSIGSQDIIRLESTDNHFTREYLFAYLQQKFVFDYIQSMKYGSVIERIEPFHVESIPVVEPTKDLSETVTKIIQQYSDCTYKAFVAEETAISLVEKAIESWEK